MADRLRITELDFDTIKTNLKSFLNQQNTFTDYDFDGSGLSILLDILAYNTHYNAYYLNMVANEAFLDTALLRDSAVSHAKVLNYVPYSTRSSIATINLEGTSTTETLGRLTLPAGYSFLSNQIDGKSYNFVVLEDTLATKANSTYLFENLEIYEGQFVTYTFEHNESNNPKQIFTLPDNNIDTTTLKISVQQSSSNTASAVYEKVTDVINVSPTSEVYFLQEDRNGLYQIYFGNDSVGKALPDGAVVTATYLVSNASAANKANNFISTSSVTDSLGESITSFTITPISAAAGGAERETVDSIKYSAAAQFSSQNRLVTTKDYESFILNQYPNIDSINVWGGEENDPPVYGKVYVSLKPKENYFISEAEKQRVIDDIIKPKSIVTVDTEIIDPVFTYILVKLNVEYYTEKTTLSELQLKDAIRSAIVVYNDDNLNRFDSVFVQSKLQESIDDVDTSAIIGSDTSILLQKRFEPQLGTSRTYTIEFDAELNRSGDVTNRLTSTQFNVFDSTGVLRTVEVEEVTESFTGVRSVEVINPGVSYSEAPTVTISGDGIGATAEAVLRNGKIQSINVINRGTGYSKATITISGGNGYGAVAVAVLDSRFGSLRTVYFNSLAEKQIVNDSAGTIDYNTGTVTLNDLVVISNPETDSLIRLTVEAQKAILTASRNTIFTIDSNDTNSIVTELIPYV